MDLTPEERRQIYEEEKARIEVKQSRKQLSTSQRRFVGGAFALLIVIALIGLAVSRRNGVEPAPEAVPGAEEPISLDWQGQVRRVLSEGLLDDAVRQNIRDADRTVTFEQLKKNAERYAGRPWRFSGKIVQIQEASGFTTVRVALDAWGNKVVYVVAPFTTEFVDGDRVYVVGYLAGDHSYQSIAGWNITIPAMAARAILNRTEGVRLESDVLRKPVDAGARTD